MRPMPPQMPASFMMGPIPSMMHPANNFLGGLGSAQIDDPSLTEILLKYSNQFSDLFRNLSFDL
jgi:hypothetical protein